MAGLPDVFERYRAVIDSELKSVLADYRSPLYDMMRYHLGWVDEKGNPLPGGAGKALRPTLCLLACEAVGEDYTCALPAAAAIELVHNYSLIHDDIQDDDRERRHRPTVWSIWGKPQAINAGSAMRLLSNMAILRLRENGVTPEKQARVQYLLDEASLRLIEGQYLDIEFENRFDITVNDYLEMIGGKTAALISCSLEVGALLGTSNKDTVESFRSIGKSLGLAFQMRDDILGIWGNPGETGKPLANDIRRRKKTLPIVYALEKAASRSHEELVTIYHNEIRDESTVSRVLDILEEIAARQGAQTMVEQYSQMARQVFDRMTLAPKSKQEIEELVHFLTTRDF